MKRGLLVLGLVLLAPLAALATPYVPSELMSETSGGEDAWVISGTGPALPAGSMSSYDPLTRYTMCCDFIVTLQVSDTTTIDYGGMREGEHMLSVIQSDNTSESIWLWSHYYRLSGTDPYHGNVDAAWEYIMNHPAYDEEGNDDWITGYYRRYNCSWALRAVMEYSDVYGDATYSAYGDSCASYLCHNPMKLSFPTGAARRLNGLIMAWAVGNLYEYGEYVGNPTFSSKAVAIADSVMVWADNNPNKFHWREWAMDGGVLLWGIVHSVFADDPTGLDAWVTASAPYVATEILPTAGAYQNAWRGWAALGQSTAAEVLDSPTYAGYFQHLADTLVANDGDSDGGIPVLDADPDNYDQSWVTNYMGFMCMDRLLSTAGAPEATFGGPTLQVAASPTPSAGLPTLALSLAAASPVRLGVYDASGRVVADRDLGVLAPGAHRLDLGREAGLAGTSPGIYFYQVRTAGETARGKIVVLR